MPPKIKVTKQKIIDAALNAVRKEGEAGLNARTLASMLECSTQPVFSNFASMEDLKEAITTAAYDEYLSFLRKEAESEKYPLYKSFGMAYIRFAKEEKELFKFLFMRDRSGKDLPTSPDFNASVEIIMKTNGISKEQAELMHLELWAFVHGIATMHATSFLTLEWDFISHILSDAYYGIRGRMLSEEKEK